MKNTLMQLAGNKYLRSYLVLAIDIFVSVLATALVLLLTSLAMPGLFGREAILTSLLVCAGISLVAFYSTGVYKSVIRYSTLRELGEIAVSVLIKEILSYSILLGVLGGAVKGSIIFVIIATDFAVTFTFLVIVRVLMLVLYYMWCKSIAKERSIRRVAVYGQGEKSVAVVTRLRNSSHYKVVCMLEYSDNGRPHTPSSMIMGLPVWKFNDEKDIEKIKNKYSLDGVLFSYHSDAMSEQNRLVEFCREAKLKLYIAPGIDEMPEGKLFTSGIRKIKIEDLLGRSEIEIPMAEVKKRFEGKRILVTGAAGSIGSELCRQLVGLGVGELIMFDNAETPLHNVRLEFEDRWPNLKFTPVIGDVRHTCRLDMVFRKYRPEIVFHAAAYKHVPLMEENPCEAVRVNVIGSRNVADKCVEYGVERMVMISTDKAVNPTNIMGCTKRLAEIYVQSLGLAIESGAVKGKTTFVTTRFGNVLGSNGSVIPRFKEQIERGGPVTVTDPEIRRYFMTIPEACRLVMEAATMATGTQIFVFDMGEPVKIADLAKKMIHLAGYEVDKDVKIQYTGLRPGEKLYEEVLATKENTIPTEHKRIFIAKVRAYGYDNAVEVSDRLNDLSNDVDIPNMVKLMKSTVPEFISKHSPFEIYDIKE